jgi:hypothetical protein
MVVYVCNPNTQEAEAGRGSRPAWATQQVWSQSSLHSETVSKQTTK